jgi:hypothetical protein
MSSALRQLAEDIGGFATDPFGYVLYNYPWGEPGPLAELRGPRQWQADILREIGSHLSNPATRFTPLRLAVAKGHGVGFSALMGMLVCWSLDTCVDTRVIITANTENQLQTRTSPELGKWRRMALTSDWFNVSTMSHTSTQRGHGQSWRADLITWSEARPEGFQGLHNQGRRIAVFMDEASGIDDAIFDAVAGMLTDEQTELLWLVGGNPSRNVGRFREAFSGGKHQHLWSSRQLDSRTVEGVNLDYVNEMIETYGETSDIAKVRVLGQFPSASSLQFIGSDLVRMARQRQPVDSPILPSDPIVMGLDVARFGGDCSVLAIRQGRDARSRPWRKWSGADTMTLASDVAQEFSSQYPDALFIDGGGVGGGVVDRLRQLLGDDAPLYEVNFGAKGGDATFNGSQRVRCANRRAMMWQEMKAWLERGIIPDDEQLAADLIGPEYSYDAASAILLEKKEHMRSRGLASPDAADALALTFAAHVEARQVPGYLDPDNYGRGKDFDRYAELDAPGGYERE